jgi:hypothetical protein
MAPPDEKPPSAPSAPHIANGVKSRDRLHHLLRTAQGNAENPNHKTGHKRPKPSLPKLPWNDPK